MNKKILRGFCHRSREWSRAARGLDLLHMAATDLREFVDADSGFFVYKKRVLVGGVTPQKVIVYATWGVFAGDEVRLQGDIDHVLEKRELLYSKMEQWILAENLPSKWHEAWHEYGLLELGIWPLVSREQVIGAIVVARTEPSDRVSLETRTALMDSCAAQVSLALDLILTRRIAEEASQRDLLTGLFNRRGLEARLPQLVHECENTGNSLVVGLIDMDNLKQVNDTHGHPIGDNALQQVADILSRNVRSDDIVARFGGDEFAVVIQCDSTDAGTAMERIRKCVEEQSDGLSVSVGGAVWGIDGDSLEQCYVVADERLYECKRLAKADAVI
ncbi:GGDEF domain-containing protein [Alicyclobacillus mengziensis]|uniref:GGDEF domain-containing protein n=1 Tax=Alicyclobacillus mengziensis TaxID=2931921 RepID=A0A9X7VUS4_9BACL|nr:GGDEF domain-containing protein [Alicyclobacillus mengziensis]QSO45491.1 GGDEF domain-containing protein [Alicyclobacillus mengziensis]